MIVEKRNVYVEREANFNKRYNYIYIKFFCLSFLSTLLEISNFDQKTFNP